MERLLEISMSPFTIQQWKNRPLHLDFHHHQYQHHLPITHQFFFGAGPGVRSRSWIELEPDLEQIELAAAVDVVVGFVSVVDFVVGVYVAAAELDCPVREPTFPCFE